MTIGDVMDEMAISEFKAKCLAVLERVHKTKRPICITRHGKPVAEVVPPSSIQERSAWIGSMKGSVEIIGDIISPANEESEWEALQD
jgi:prevent-host-death family protein